MSDPLLVGDMARRMPKETIAAVAAAKLEIVRAIEGMEAAVALNALLSLWLGFAVPVLGAEGARRTGAAFCAAIDEVVLSQQEPAGRA